MLHISKTSDEEVQYSKSNFRLQIHNSFGHKTQPSLSKMTKMLSRQNKTADIDPKTRTKLNFSF
jgi:hypothetical protein